MLLDPRILLLKAVLRVRIVRFVVAVVADNSGTRRVVVFGGSWKLVVGGKSYLVSAEPAELMDRETVRNTTGPLGSSGSLAAVESSFAKGLYHVGRR